MVDPIDQSGFSSNTTEKLPNNYNTSKKLWEVNHSMLVSTTGDYTFKYELSTTFCDMNTVPPCGCGTNTTRPCKYELIFKIMDPNGAWMNFSGTTNTTPGFANLGEPPSASNAFTQASFPASLLSPYNYELNVTVNFSIIGTYTIVKELRLRDEAVTVGNFAAPFLVNPPVSNACLTLPTTPPCDPEPTVGTEPYPVEDCGMLLDIFKSDMAPGGQYFDNLKNLNETVSNDWLNAVGLPHRTVVNVFPTPTTPIPLVAALATLVNGLEPDDATVTITDANGFWNTIRNFWVYDAVKTWFFDTGTNSLKLWEYHPEFPHYKWCTDIASLPTTPPNISNIEFNTTLNNYTSVPTAWLSLKNGCSLPTNQWFVSHAIVNDDPYFKSALGLRKVTSRDITLPCAPDGSSGIAGITGRELMNYFICRYPIQLPTGSDNNTYNCNSTNGQQGYRTMWEQAVSNAGAGATDDQQWKAFAKLYLAKKEQIIKYQKSNPCGNDQYAPYLADKSDDNTPLDFIADCPRLQTPYIWGSHPYCIGSGSGDQPWVNIHHVFKTWPFSSGGCTQSVQTYNPKGQDVFDAWSNASTIACAGSGTPCNPNLSNKYLAVTDRRAAGFVIRVPDTEQNIMDVSDDDAAPLNADGIFGGNDSYADFANTGNAYNPCLGSTGFYFKLPSNDVYDTEKTANEIIAMTSTNYAGLRFLYSILVQVNVPATTMYLFNSTECNPPGDNIPLQIATANSTCSLVQGPFLSFEEFYNANTAFFNCLANCFNSSFPATHNLGEFVVKPNITIPPKSSLAGKPDCGECCPGSGACTQPDVFKCWPLKNTCIDQYIPHCLCGIYDAAAATGNAAQAFFTQYLGAWADLSAAQTFANKLSTHCNTIKNPNASQNGLTAAINAIQGEVNGLAQPWKSMLDCFNLVPDPCDETSDIIGYGYEVAFYQAGQDIINTFATNYRARCLNPTTAPDKLKVTYTDKEYDFTLYYYSPDGNLYATVPPEGVYLLPTTTNFDQIATFRSTNTLPTSSQYKSYFPLHRRNHSGSNAKLRYNQLMTVYEYDSFDNVVKSTSPDHQKDASTNEPDGSRSYGSTHFVYDNLGRIRVSQDPRQLALGRASYVKYDQLSRTVESGQYNYSGSDIANDATLLTNIATPTFPSAATFTLEDYMLATYDVASTETDIVAAFGGTGMQRNLQNRASFTQYHQTEAVVDHASYYSYNIQGDVAICLQKDPTLLTASERIKRFDYELGLVDGQTYALYYQKGKLDALTHFYDYDAVGRLQETITTNDRGAILDRDSRQFYRIDGVLGREEIGEHKVQGIDHAYTTLGWTKGVNSTNLSSARDIGKDSDATAPATVFGQNKWVAKDAFGYTLSFFASDYNPISTVISNAPFEANLVPHASGAYFNTFAAAIAEVPSSPVAGMYNGNVAAMQTALTKTDGTGADLIASGYRYDQRMRIRKAYTAKTASNSTAYTNNTWSGATGVDVQDYRSSYTYDRSGNIASLNRNGNATAGLDMDKLTYNYDRKPTTVNGVTVQALVRNRLINATEQGTTYSGNYTSDIEGQAANNYGYDFIGNLVSDLSEGIATITWTVTGKVKEVKRVATSIADDVEYRYDSNGDRIEKIVKPKVSAGVLKDQKHWTSTLYVRTPDGEVMATYERAYKRPTVGGSTTINQITRLPNEGIPTDLDDDLVVQSGVAVPSPLGTVNTLDLGTPTDDTYLAEVIKLKELHLYSSRRLGMKNMDRVMNLTFFNNTGGYNGTTKRFNSVTITRNNYVQGLYPYQTRKLSGKDYELTNHLGNVMVVVSDRKVPAINGLGNPVVTNYVAQAKRYSDYYPFGMEMPGRVANSEQYRYGFNGKENDRSWKGGTSDAGLIQDYGFRLYNPALGRFLSVDPLAPDFPWYTPYQFSGNRPIYAIDLDGAEEQQLIKAAIRNRIFTTLKKSFKEGVESRIKAYYKDKSVKKAGKQLIDDLEWVLEPMEESAFSIFADVIIDAFTDPLTGAVYTGSKAGYKAWKVWNRYERVKKKLTHF
ncbi:MAG: hypothetical protein IPN76_03255 [Saprospiraceae bacterium]|nr:hypothetical protein [Saprospiraceae bacterium]